MEFRLLGPVVVEDGGRALQVGGRRQRCVLALLLLHRGTPLAGDWLIDQVWGDTAPGAVRTSLHTYVSRLRSELGAARLQTRSQGYVLHATDDEVDAASFDRLLRQARAISAPDPDVAVAAYDQALALVRGPALGDLAAEPSLQASAARLDSLVAAVRRERIDVQLRLGQHAALVPELEGLLRDDPLQEDLWGDYVLALYRCGRQADALAAYGRARAALSEELGIEPSPRLRHLHEQVLRQDSALTLAASALRGYRTLGVLGEGASAVVHRAVQPHTGRDVALKALHPWLADDPELVRRFAAEAQAALQLEHPGIVPLYDYWREPGGAFLAMRLLRGGSLAHRLDRGPMAASTVVRLAEQVARALEPLAGCSWQEPLRLDDVLLDEADNAYLPCFSLGRKRSGVTVGGAVGTAGDGTAVDPTAVGSLLVQLLDRQPVAPAQLRAVAERAAGGGFPDTDELCAALRASVAPTLPAPRRPDQRTPVRNPYKGLRAFGQADAGDFFGRTVLVERLVERLTRPAPDGPRRFLAVVGPSGSGKSSLVRAGLVPALREGALTTGHTWYVAEMTPGPDPFAELVRAVQDVAVRTPRPDTADRLRAGLGTLSEEVAGLLPDDGGELLLVVDQFEELFTIVDDTDRRAFVAQLAAAAAQDSRVRIVVTLRADFYDRPLADPALAELLRQGTEVVVPLTPEELQQAVVGPSTRVGLRIAPALLAQVVADSGDTSTSLPLLQYALTELADRRRGSELTLAGYRELGGVSGALVRRAESTYLALSGPEQSIARQVLLQLVHPDDSGANTRRKVAQAELELRTGDPATARTVLTSLADARLIAFDRDPTTRVPTVEVAHEALLREWALLRGWLDGARDDLRTERRVTATAGEWDDSGRDPSFLPTGSRLDALERWAERWAVSGGWTATPVERDYLTAALLARDMAAQAEQRRRDHERLLEQRSVRRLRVAAAVLAVAVVGVSGLTVFGFSQRDRAERESLVARARALAAASAASLANDPERGVLLALEAVRLTQQDADGLVLPEVGEALHTALAASRVQLTVPGVGGAVDWSSDDVLVTEGPEDSGLVELRDAATGDVALSVEGHKTDVNDVAFSPDGGRLLTTGDDGAARLWDPRTGRLLWEHIATGQVWAPTFSGDGTRMAASWEGEGVVRIFDVAGGGAVGELRAAGGPRTSALTNDGALIVVPGGPDSGTGVYDVRTGRQVQHVAADGPVPSDVRVSSDGRWLATAGNDFKVRLWGVADGRPRGTLYTSSPVPGVDWSPDSSRIVVGGEDGIVRVFEVTDEGTREDLRLSSTVLRGVYGVAFSPDGSRVLLGDLDSRATQVFDVSPAGSREWFTAAVPKALVGADFAADGSLVASSAVAGGLELRDVRTGRVLRSTGSERGTIAELASSPDGSLVAGGADGALVVWDASTGAESFSLPAKGTPWELTWSHDGELLGFTDDDFDLIVVDRRGRVVAAPPQEDPAQGILTAAFSPDGRVVVTGHVQLDRNVLGTGHVEVFDRELGRVVRRWDGDVERLAVSPDGRLLAVAVAGGDVFVHDLATGERRLALAGHVGRVWDVQFSADSRLLASSGQDATVRLWDARTGQQQVALRGHDSGVLTGRFSPDGERLVSTSGDGTVRLWALDLEDLVQLAEERSTRSLTDDECRLFLQRTCD